MKNKKLFQMIDVIIFFNIIIFFGSGISVISENLLLAIVFILLAIFNAVFLILSILLRAEYNKRFLEKIDLEIKTDNNMSQKNQAEYNKAKQIFLETRIESEVKQKMPNAKIIRNAYVPRADGKKSEIDLIVISTQGIFIIESKNVTGKIMGNWKQDVLSLQHPGGETYKFSNPINQNTQHFYSLRSYLGINNNLYRSIVVFGDLTYIDSYKEIPFHAQICQLDNLIYSMNKISKRYGTTLEEHMVDSIYNNLISWVEKSEEKEKEHVSRIKSSENN